VRATCVRSGRGSAAVRMVVAWVVAVYVRAWTVVVMVLMTGVVMTGSVVVVARSTRLVVGLGLVSRAVMMRRVPIPVVVRVPPMTTAMRSVALFDTAVGIVFVYAAISVIVSGPAATKRGRLVVHTGRLRTTADAGHAGPARTDE
jgi:hypothetical protein